MVCLIPEFCYITGLTDAVRQDFRVMKVSFFQYNRIAATKRVTFDSMDRLPKYDHSLESC